jgi:hypothetical protein
LNLQSARELEQQLLGAQQALLVADAACFHAVDQLVKRLFFGPVSGKCAPSRRRCARWTTLVAVAANGGASFNVPSESMKAKEVLNDFRTNHSTSRTAAARVKVVVVSFMQPTAE